MFVFQNILRKFAVMEIHPCFSTFFCNPFQNEPVSIEMNFKMKFTSTFQFQDVTPLLHFSLIQQIGSSTSTYSLEKKFQTFSFIVLL